MDKTDIPLIIDVPKAELQKFDAIIREYRNKNIRASAEIVEVVLKSDGKYLELIKANEVSVCISELREAVWNEYLKEEVEFNAILMKDLYTLLKTHKEILDGLLEKVAPDLNKEELASVVREICGEYAGRVYPYLYRLSLSNTQSRRIRSGITFESIIYKIYDLLGYPYDSQSKIGRKIFDDAGLGKKVDSILPGIDYFRKRRNKTIVGTMKTSLRERWQEVAEEIERTKIPEIHLLTADESIAVSKIKEMANHNITLVTLKWVADSDSLKQYKNIISFEEYFFREIPDILRYWDANT